MPEYDHQRIEEKWQKRWAERNSYRALDTSSQEKYYFLVEFPYPSGDGLHVGHVRSYTALDILARKRRGEGYNVLYPIGWDAFGLPTENYAIKIGIAPKIITKQNTDNFRRQLKAMGFSFDWSREINTTDSSYYKWTQWIFLKLFEKGLAYKARIPINWCPKDKIGLANEEVVTHSTSSGHVAVCERCGTPVEKREKEQWMLAITKYAQRLYDDLDTVNYIERVKVQQRNWIGPSEGAEIDFKLAGISGQTDGVHTVKIFTTRPDTIFGATFLAISPELAKKWLAVGWQVDEKVKTFVESELRTRMQTAREEKEKKGVDAGIFAINPASKEKIPVWVVNYVLGDVGTGAIMAVPAHDERDFDFAQRFHLPIRQVVLPSLVDLGNPPREDKENTRRTIVHVILLHPSEEKFVALRHKSQPWLTPITGGVEEGEDPQEAASREIFEETGYEHAEYVDTLPYVLNARFYAAHKDVNRDVIAHVYTFRLKDLSQKELSEEESGKHTVEWLPLSQLHTLHPVAEIDHIVSWVRQRRGAFTGDGVLMHSGGFDGMPSLDAKEAIVREEKGEWDTTYKLRDWVFSRQRYWGEPIPMVFCESCAQKDGQGWVPVPESELPVTLPEVEKYQPTDTGESPLSAISEWVTTTCPKCGGEAKRESDVMPNWAGSSWYYLRYVDPHNNKSLADIEKLKYWTPVDWYNGGMEHTTLHLLYSRFWHKFLYDIGVVPTPEPYVKRTSHGLILAPDGEKMSKSKGNVINPDDIIMQVGADTLRIHEMFLGPFDQSVLWSMGSIAGSRRFLERVLKAADHIADVEPDSALSALSQKTIKKVSEDIEGMKFNTAISQLMIFLNVLEKYEHIPKESFLIFLRLLAPFAPHLTEEVGEMLGRKESIHTTPWPTFDARLMEEEISTVAVQVNGKVRGTITASPHTPEDEMVRQALSLEAVRRLSLAGGPRRVVYVPGRVINLIFEDA